MSARGDETTGETAVVVVDVSGYRRPDLPLVDTIMRVRLGAGRLGASFAVLGAGPDLVRLLEFLGLLAVVALDASPPSRPLGEPEPSEEPSVEEVVDVSDPPTSNLHHLDGPRFVSPSRPTGPVLGESR